MIFPTDVLTQPQLEFVASRLPEPQAVTGRPAYTNTELLPGILKVLRSGCRWRDLNLPGYPSGVTHWRRLQYWTRDNHFRTLWELLLQLLLETGQLTFKAISLDGSLLTSFAFKEGSGFSGNHKRQGVKISMLVEGKGIPIAMMVTKGNIADITLAIPTIKAIRLSHRLLKGGMLHADKGYDALELRLFAKEIGMSPHISVKRNGYLGDRDLFYYDKIIAKRRYVVERTNAWMKSFRRLRMRFDYKASSFNAFLYLGIIVICVRKLLV